MTPRYGALGATFQLARLFQTISLIAIIGITAKFISSILSNNAIPPTILIGILSVVSLHQHHYQHNTTQDKLTKRNSPASP